MIDHLCVRRLACAEFPREDAVKIAAFAAAVRRLAEDYFEYEIVTDFFFKERDPRVQGEL